MNEQNRALHRALTKLLNEATFPLQAKEVNAFIKVYDWVKTMPDQFVEKPQKKKPRVKNGD